MADIEFTSIHPDMVVHPRVLDLPPLRGHTLADQITENASEPDLFARVARALALAQKVRRMETALDQITADAMADHDAAREAGNVVAFRGRGV